MLIKSNAESIKEREEFKKRISDETGCNISEMEFAELRADKYVYKALGIETESWQVSSWGLILFTDKDTFYFTCTQENYLARLMRSSKTKEKESLVNLSTLKDLNFFLPRRSFFSFLNAESKRTLEASFIDAEGKRQFFKLITSGAAFDLWKKLSSTFSRNSEKEK